MCKKLPYNNPRKDKCLISKIDLINAMKVYRTLSSCCGHKKYPETIVVMDRKTHYVYEYNSKIFLGFKRRKGNRYYKKDKDGYYYLPEVRY